MENSQIAQHMAMLYEKGLYTDSVIHIFGRTFRVHRSILSMSGYFQAVMSEIWMNNLVPSSVLSSPLSAATAAAVVVPSFHPSSTTSGGGTTSTTLTASVNNTHSNTNGTVSVVGPSPSTTVGNHPSLASLSKVPPGGWNPNTGGGTGNTSTDHTASALTLTLSSATNSHQNSTNHSPSLSPALPPYTTTTATTTATSSSSSSSLSVVSPRLGGGTGGSLPSSSSSSANGSASILEFFIDTSDYERYTSSSSSSVLVPSGIPRSSLKNYSPYAGDITVNAFEDVLRFLYGFIPTINPSNAKSLLVTASYFDVPLLMSQVADYIFANLSIDNVIEYLLLVYEKEYGEPGKLIEDASLAYLYRNAIDINPSRLRSLPLSYQKKLLLANELYTPSEFARYKLALTIKQAVRSLIMEDMVQANVRLPSHMLLSSVSANGNGSIKDTNMLTVSTTMTNTVGGKENDTKIVSSTMITDFHHDRADSSYTRVPSNTRSSVSSPLGTDTPSSTPLSTNGTYTVRIRDTLPNITTAGNNHQPSGTGSTVPPPSTPLTVRRLRIDTSSSSTTTAVNPTTNDGTLPHTRTAVGTTGASTSTIVNSNPYSAMNYNHGLYDLPSASSISSESTHPPNTTSLSSSVSTVHDTVFHPTTITMPAPLSTRSYNSIRRLATFSPASYSSNNSTLHSQLHNNSSSNSNALTRTNVSLGSMNQVPYHRTVDTMDETGVHTITTMENALPHLLNEGSSMNDEEEDHTSLLSTAQTIPPPSTTTNTAAVGNRSNHPHHNNNTFHYPIGRGRGHALPHYNTNTNTNTNNANGGTGTIGSSSNPQIFRFPSQIEEEMDHTSNRSSRTTDHEDIIPITMMNTDNHRNDTYFANRRSSNVDMDQEQSVSITPSHNGNQGVRYGSSSASSSSLWSSSASSLPFPPPPVPSSSSLVPESSDSMYDPMIDTDDYSSDDHYTYPIVSINSSSYNAILPSSTFVGRDSQAMDEQDVSSSSSSVSSTYGNGNHASTGETTNVNRSASLKHGNNASGNGASINNSNNLLPDQVLPLSPAGPILHSLPSIGNSRTNESHSTVGETVMGTNTNNNLNSPSSVILQAVTLRDFYNELEELESTYTEIFQSIRWIHLSSDEIEQVRRDNEVPSSLLDQAIIDQTLMREKLELANRYNVRRLTELDNLTPEESGVPLPVRDFKWPAFRIGLEMTGVFAEIHPTNDNLNPNETRSQSSERVYFAGSMWCLDLKRYTSTEDNSEYVAVYLRRRSMANARVAATIAAAANAVNTIGTHETGNPTIGTTTTTNNPTAMIVNANPVIPWEDTRERTTMGFSIRLCGAPGAPTSNSVCGRSVMGKAFGIDAEQSWGWESFVAISNLTERPWASGDKLRFVINLDML